MRPSDRFRLPLAADCKTAKPVSSTRLGLPCEQAINHLYGHILGGLRHAQSICTTPTDTSDTARFKTYRHPNADYIDVCVRLGSEPSETPWSVQVQAGTGAAQTLSTSVEPTTNLWFTIRAPWGAADADDCDVVVTFASVAIGGLFAWDVPREELTTGDSRIEHLDPSYPRVGMAIDRYIGASTTAGPKALLQETIDAWAYCQPQIMSWWTPLSSPLSVSGGSYADFFDSATFKHQARQKQSTDTSTNSRWYAYIKCDGTVNEYALKVSATNPGAAANDNVEQTGLAGSTSWAWSDKFSDLAIDCAVAATLKFEGKVTDGSGNIYLGALSGIGG